MTYKQQVREMNRKRAGWAKVAINAFSVETGTDEEDALSDLLADLQHLADVAGWDFHSALARGTRAYTEEQTEL